MIDSYLPNEVDGESLRLWLASVSETDRDLMTSYIVEAAFFRSVLESEILRLPAGSRVLEIGSGIGLLSRWIASLGHSVVAFEPGAAGFTSMSSLSMVVDTCWKGVPPVVQTIPHTFDLSRVRGTFDLVLAINVIEHVPDPSLLISEASSLIRLGGRGRFICPNYAFPYEPHFSIPTLFGKRATARVMNRRIRGSSFPDAEEFWRNLSWPTVCSLHRELARRQVPHTFGRDGLLFYAKRLADPQFLSRKGRFFGLLAGGSITALELILKVAPLAVAPIIDLTTYGSRADPSSR